MKENPGSYENKDIPINVFESIQIDFKPVKPRKRRKIDDYDYNDPFLEPFEGELDAVDLECKLENFFVYKGVMEDDPRKIARRYNNSLKKTKLCDAIASADQRIESSGPAVLFEFERMLASVLNPRLKYKKESKLENSLMYVVFMESPKNDVEHYLKYKLLSQYNDKKYGSGLKHVDPRELERGLEILRTEIENMFKFFLMTANDSGNFSEDGRSFNKLKESEFAELMVDFCVKYMKYYAATTNESMQYVKNRSLEYLNVMLPDRCTNKIRLRHYLLKSIHSRIENDGYSLKDVAEGNFVRLDDIYRPVCHEGSVSPRSTNLDDSRFSHPLEESRRPDFVKTLFPSSYHAVGHMFSNAFVNSYGIRNASVQGATENASRDLLVSSDAMLSSVSSSTCTLTNAQELLQSTGHGQGIRDAADTNLLPPVDDVHSSQNKYVGFVPEAFTNRLPQDKDACTALNNSTLEAEKHPETILTNNSERKRKQKTKPGRGKGTEADPR